MSWSCALLMSGSLQQNVTDAAINEWRKWLRACVCKWTTFEHVLWAFPETEKSRADRVELTLCILKKMFLYCRVCDFQGFKVSQGKICTWDWWGGKLNFLLIAYLLSNICTKNYQSRATTVKIIVGGWVVYFFETHCTITQSRMHPKHKVTMTQNKLK